MYFFNAFFQNLQKQKNSAKTTDTPAAARVDSVEDGLPVRCGGRVEAHPDLRGGVLLLRQLRQFVSAEIRAAGRFEVFPEFTANQPAENKDLANAVGVGRRIVPIAVLHRDQPQRGDGQAGFFTNLLFRIGTDRFIHIHPAAGERPAAVILPNQQDFSVPENRRARIELWGLKSSFTFSSGISDFTASISAAISRIR